MSKVTLSALICSIALNFALIGYLIGKESAPAPKFDPTRAYLKWSRGLEEDRFHELRRTLRPHLPRDRSRLRALRQQNRLLADALKAPQFDRDEVDRALRAMRDNHLAAQEQSHAAFLTFVEALSPEERERFAEDMLKRRHAGPGREFGPHHQLKKSSQRQGSPSRS